MYHYGTVNQYQIITAKYDGANSDYASLLADRIMHKLSIQKIIVHNYNKNIPT